MSHPIDEARFKISGLGGQGVLLLGQILAQAGPEADPEARAAAISCENPGILTRSSSRAGRMTSPAELTTVRS